MTAANQWAGKTVDSKSAEGASEPGRKHGLSLGDWLSQAILAHEEAVRQSDGPTVALARPEIEGPDQDWRVHDAHGDRIREALDALAQRLDATERRQALALTGLDRTVIGLAARVEDAEAGARRASSTVTSMAGDLRRAAVEIAERLQDAEEVARGASEDSARAARAATERFDAAHAEIMHRIGATETQSRAVAEALAAELKSAQQDLIVRIGDAERAAQSAAASAVQALRTEQSALAARIADAEARSGAATAEALAALKADQAAVEQRLARLVEAAHAKSEQALADSRSALATLSAQIAEAAAKSDDIVAKTVAELRQSQADLAARLSAAERDASSTAARAEQDLRAAQSTLDARLAQMEQNTRDATANMRAGAAAAINQVRASQLEIEKKLKELDVTEASEARAALEARLERLEKENAGAGRAALHMLDAKITGLASAVREGRERTAHDIDTLRAQIAEGAGGQIQKSLDEAIKRLTERLEQAEATANQALRSLESAAGQNESTESLRAVMEQRLDGMSATMSELMSDVRSEVAAQIAALPTSGADTAELQEAVADVNRRLASAERRQAQTIDAISFEIRRMTESVDKRLRALESRNDDAAAEAVRDEIARLSASLESRIEEVQTREAAGYDRMGAEVGRLAERFDQRFEDVERRSAEALETIGDQVARVAERLGQRQDQLAKDLAEQVVASEERQGGRLTDAIAALTGKINQVAETTQSTLTPVQRAMASLAARLQAVEDGARGAIDAYQDDLAVDSYKHPLPEPEREEFSPEPISDDAPPEPAVADSGEKLDIDEFEPPELDLNETDELPWRDPAPEGAPHEETERVGPQAADDDLFASQELPPAKNDYLAAARRAAQAQAQPVRGKRAEKAAEASEEPKLRGRTRIIAWGAAGVIALTIAGGAYLMRQGDAPAKPAPKASPAPRPEPQPEALPPTAPPEAADALGAATPEALPPETGHTPLETEAAPPPPTAQKTSALPSAITATLDQAALRGDAVAQYDLALQRLQAGAPLEGVTWLRKAANQGLAMAQYRLGKIYERGEGGVPIDLVQARQWTERAAAAGNRKAMHDLGVFYARGEGAPLDEAVAFRWFRQAAELGVADSQYNLGVLYQQGRGVAANPTEALYWFNVAAKSGDLDARARAAALQAQLGAEQSAQIAAKAEEFAAKPLSARANGEFGQRSWISEAQLGTGQPRS